MKEGAIFGALLVVLMVSALVSAEQIIDISMTVQQDGNASLDEIKLVEGRPTFYIKPGEYSLILTGSSGKIIKRTDLSLDYIIYSDPPIRINTSFLKLKIPYSPEMKQLKFYKKDRLLLSAEINFCNSNGKCETEQESFQTCPKDCPLESKDEMCLGLADGVCDPDCASGVDPDCQPVGSRTRDTKSVTTTTLRQGTQYGNGIDNAPVQKDEMMSEAMHKSVDLNYLYAALFIVVAAVTGFFAYRRLRR